MCRCEKESEMEKVRERKEEEINGVYMKKGESEDMKVKGETEEEVTDRDMYI